MKKLLEKAASVIIAMSILVCAIPGFSAFAADPQLSGSVSLSGNNSLFNRHDAVTVNIDLTSRAYDQVIGDEPNDIVLLIDRSASMHYDYSNMIDAARNFVDIMDLSTHRIGIIAYDSPNSTSSQPITNDKDILKTFLDTLETSGTQGSTGMGEGVNQASSMLASKRADAQGTIVLMTDGQPDNRITALSSAASAKSSGYVFYTVALTSSSTSAANTMLKQMATSESDHYFVMDSAQLKPVYDKIAKKIGKTFPKNITVTQSIPAGLQLVPGSEKNSIPVPAVSSNRLTWSMNQMGEGTAKLVYQLQADVSSSETSALCGSGNITYTDYAGVTQTINLNGEGVTITRPMLAVNSISPNTGTANTETNVTISGENFSPDCTVKVNGTSASDVVVSADGRTITAKLPGLPEGTHRVTVTNGAGQYDYIDFNVEAPSDKLAIYSVTPNQAEPKTPVTVTVIGCGFISPTAKMGNLNLNAHDVSPDGTSFKADIPGLLKGTYTITVTNSRKEKATIPFTVKVPDPIPVTIDSITPPTGGAKTSVTIEIKGSGFIDPTVKVGNMALPVYDVSADGTSLKADFPALSKGSYVISVTNKYKKVAKKSFSVVPVPPTPKTPVVIDSITPDSETAKTDVTVTIAGSGFTDPTVKIGALVLPVHDVSPDGTSMKADIQGLAAGTYTIKVENKDGSSANTSFTFAKAPPAPSITVTGINPAKGEEKKAETVTITGTNFKAPTAKIGNLNITVHDVAASGDSLQVDIPALLTGTYTIKITDSGSSASINYTVEKVIPVTTPVVIDSITPDKGEIKTDISVTIVGDGFIDPTVKIGNLPLTVTNVAADGKSLEVTVPGLAAGTYSIKVTNKDGNSASIPFTFVKTPPTPMQIDTITPDTAEAGQSVTVTLTGTGMTDPTVKLGSLNIPVTNVSGDGTSLEFTIPSLSAGDYTITVTNSSGSSAKTSFTFSKPVPPPVQPVTITDISQDTEITGTPVTVTITGTNMTNPKVQIGNLDLVVSNVDVDGSSLQAEIPGLTTGSYTIKVTNDQGQSASVVFSFVPKPEPPAVQIDSITPGSITAKTATSITITGTGLDNPVVKVGNLPLVVTSAAPDGTSLTVDLPSLYAGTYTISVTNSAGKKASKTVTVVKP